MHWVQAGTSVGVGGVGVGRTPQLWGQNRGTTVAVATDTVVRPSLEARINELDQQIKILQRLREISADSAAGAAKDRQSATANAKDGFSIKSADGKYSLRFRGYIQSDGRFFPSSETIPTVDNLLIRRARPIRS